MTDMTQIEWICPICGLVWHGTVHKTATKEMVDDLLREVRNLHLGAMHDQWEIPD
jgi:hypothetical protein